MGGANSKIDFGRLTRPSRITSGKELVASTKEVREMADSLFRFMYDEFGEKEVMDMAMDPEKYVIALSDLITTKFEVIGYITKNNQMGELYFAKYTDLNPLVSKPDLLQSEKERLQKNQRENSMMIAFYYVRLFQILGSLLIIIKDIKFEIPVEGANPINLGSKEIVGYSGRPSLQQGTRLPRFQPGYYPQSGGAVTNQALGAYEFLRLYMDKVQEGDPIRQLFTAKPNTILFKITSNLYFEFDPTYQQIKESATIKQRFLLKTKGGDTPTQDYESTIINISPTPHAFKSLEEFTRVEDINRYIPYSVLIGIKAKSVKQATNKTPYPILFEKRIDIIQQDDEIRRGVKYNIKDGITTGAGSFVSSARTLTRTNSSGTPNIGEIFENALIAYTVSISSEKDLRLFTSADRDSQSREVSQRKIGQLKDKLENNLLNDLYQLMKQGTQPKAGQQIVPFQSHCISRALQLLDTKSISELIPTTAKTSVCKFSIGDKSVPTIGQYEPIKSLAQLYGKINPADFKKSERVLQAFVRYRNTSGDKIPTGPLTMSNLKGADQKNEVNDLQSAIDRLNKAFNYLEATLPVVDGIMTIPVKKPKECKTSEEIEVGSQPTALAMQSYAHQLMAFHVNQTIEISKFLQTIFDVKKDSGTGRWIVKGPREDYMFAGFPVLDQLTNQARELLVDYYSGCETLYQKGVKAWVDSQPTLTNTKANP
jgi:hypothetical protein